MGGSLAWSGLADLTARAAGALPGPKLPGGGQPRNQLRELVAMAKEMKSHKGDIAELREVLLGDALDSSSQHQTETNVVRRHSGRCRHCGGFQ